MQPLMKGQENDSDRQRMLSGLIDKMSKDGMLLPEKCLNLGSIVGQGQNSMCDSHKKFIMTLL